MINVSCNFRSLCGLRASAFVAFVNYEQFAGDEELRNKLYENVFIKNY